MDKRYEAIKNFVKKVEIILSFIVLFRKSFTVDYQELAFLLYISIYNHLYAFGKKMIEDLI